MCFRACLPPVHACQTKSLFACAPQDTEFSEDGHLMAYQLSSGGSDWAWIQVMSISPMGEPQELPGVPCCSSCCGFLCGLSPLGPVSRGHYDAHMHQGVTVKHVSCTHHCIHVCLCTCWHAFILARMSLVACPCACAPHASLCTHTFVCTRAHPHRQAGAGQVLIVSLDA